MLLSVPHTGTYLTIRLFAACGLRESTLVPARREENTIYHGHMLKGTQVGMGMKLAQQMPLVCPLRHPYRVEESWKRRGKDVGEMAACFRIYMDKFLPLGPYIVPVDSPMRDEAIRRMSDGLGMELKPDWSVVVNGKCGTDSLSLSELSPSESVRQLVSEMNPFLARFYEAERT